MREEREEFVLASVRIFQRFIGLLAIAYVQQHVDAADQSTNVVEQWCRKGLKPSPLSVRAFRDGLFVANGATLLERDSHRGLVAGQGRAVRPIQLPADAPTIFAEGRDSTCELDGGWVEVREAAFGISGINGHWK